MGLSLEPQIEARPALAGEWPDEALTDDAFLGGRLRLWQPKSGYRAATDPVLLAAACPARPGQRVLDVGAGAGAAAFCLATRSPGVDIEGVELQPAYVALSRRNAARNEIAWLAEAGDVAAPPLFVRSTSYDHVITNPPFFEAETGLASPDPAKDAANRETVPLSLWLDFCLKRLASRGVLTLIHRIERLGDALAAVGGRVGDVEICPLWPRRGAPAKRFILRARKDGRGPMRLSPGLALHAPRRRILHLRGGGDPGGGRGA